MRGFRRPTGVPDSTLPRSGCGSDIHPEKYKKRERFVKIVKIEVNQLKQTCITMKAALCDHG